MATDEFIIIKRIKKGGGKAHHGGAWKVAYADFVTAMMAFFLLLWLINTTTPEQKLGLANYFTPTIGLKDSMGIGFRGGKKPNAEGNSRTDLSKVGLVIGQAQQGPAPGDPTTETAHPDPTAESSSMPQKPQDPSTVDSEEFTAASQDIRQSLEEDPDLKDYQNSVVVQDTPDGLKIDMIDDEKKPMFIEGTANLTSEGKKIIDTMSRIIVKTPNNIAINGHTESADAIQNPQYGNFELSSDRANATRRFLVTTQLEPERVVKISGMADRDLLVPQEPNSPRNRRVTIILMRGSYFRDPKEMPTARGLITVPEAVVKPEEKKKVQDPNAAQPVVIDKNSIFNPDKALPPATPTGTNSK